MSNNYTAIKEIFIEDNEVSDFVNLDKSTLAYHKILNALQKPLKLILFYGKPGCGKTFLLNKIKVDLEKKVRVVFVPQPFFDEKEFFLELYSQIFHSTPSEPIDNYENFMRVYRERFGISTNVGAVEQVVILLDEAQLYPGNLIEKFVLWQILDYLNFYLRFIRLTRKTASQRIILKLEFGRALSSLIQI